MVRLVEESPSTAQRPVRGQWLPVTAVIQVDGLARVALEEEPASGRFEESRFT